jgi:hypothetical protein
MTQATFWLTFRAAAATGLLAGAAGSSNCVGHEHADARLPNKLKQPQLGHEDYARHIQDAQIALGLCRAESEGIR